MERSRPRSPRSQSWGTPSHSCCGAAGERRLMRMAWPCGFAGYSPEYAVAPSAVPVTYSNGVGKRRRACSGRVPDYSVKSTPARGHRREGPGRRGQLLGRTRAALNCTITHAECPCAPSWPSRIWIARHHRGSVGSLTWIAAAGDFSRGYRGAQLSCSPDLPLGQRTDLHPD